MTPRVRLHARFLGDLRRQLAYLAEHAEDTWIEGLHAGLGEALELLAHHPNAGAAEAERGDEVLRRLVLRRVPYVLWYVVDAHEVWVLRLFHGRQSRAAPSWPEKPRGKSRRRRRA